MSEDQKWMEEKQLILEGLTGKRRSVTDKLLDNQHKLFETAAAGVTATGNVAQFQQIAMPMIRRVMPATIAMDLVGVQPMNSPVGLVYTQRIRYSNAPAGSGIVVNDERDGNFVYEKYSSIAAGEAYGASDARTAALQTAALEAQGGNEINLEVVKKSIEAKTRKLQAKWTKEADQDSKAMHGIDLESELVAALSDEIIRELDKELLLDLTNLAGTIKAFDFSLADGRYASEKFTALSIGISDLSNQIGIKTKKGGATWMVVSPDILTALRHANNGSFTSANATGEVVASQTLFAGTFNNSIKVYVDITAAANTILMGYKGSSELDTGLVYSPYVPLMASPVVTDPESYDPRIGLMTRYAITSFTDVNDSLGNSADFYARGTVSNLTLGF